MRPQLRGSSTDEELLPSSRRPRFALVLALVLVGALLIAYAATRRSRSPSRTSELDESRPSVPTATGGARNAGDVLVTGLSSGSDIDLTTRRVSFTAELINISDTPVAVLYPIHVLSGRVGEPLSRVSARIMDEQVGSFGLRSPRRLSVIAPNKHVTLWLSWRATCSGLAAGQVMSDHSHVLIRLDGFATAADFLVGSLFGPGVSRQIARLCAATAGPSN